MLVSILFTRLSPCDSSVSGRLSLSTQTATACAAAAPPGARPVRRARSLSREEMRVCRLAEMGSDRIVLERRGRTREVRLYPC